MILSKFNKGDSDDIAQIASVIEKLETSKTWESASIISGTVASLFETINKVLDINIKLAEHDMKMETDYKKLIGTSEDPGKSPVSSPVPMPERDETEEEKTKREEIEKRAHETEKEKNDREKAETTEQKQEREMWEAKIEIKENPRRIKYSNLNIDYFNEHKRTLMSIQTYFTAIAGASKLSQDICKFKSARNAPNKGIIDFTNGLMISTDQTMGDAVRTQLTEAAKSDAIRIGGQAVSDAKKYEANAEGYRDKLAKMEYTKKEGDFNVAKGAVTQAGTAFTNATESNNKIEGLIKDKKISEAQSAARKAQLSAIAAKQQAQIAKSALQAQDCRDKASDLFNSIGTAYQQLEEAYAASQKDKEKFNTNANNAKSSKKNATKAETLKAMNYYSQAHSDADIAMAYLNKGIDEEKVGLVEQKKALKSAMDKNTLPQED